MREDALVCAIRDEPWLSDIRGHDRLSPVGHEQEALEGRQWTTPELPPGDWVIEHMSLLRSKIAQSVADRQRMPPTM